MAERGFARFRLVGRNDKRSNEGVAVDREVHGPRGGGAEMEEALGWFGPAEPEGLVAERRSGQRAGTTPSNCLRHATTGLP